MKKMFFLSMLILSVFVFQMSFAQTPSPTVELVRLHVRDGGSFCSVEAEELDCSGVPALRRGQPVCMVILDLNDDGNIGLISDPSGQYTWLPQPGNWDFIVPRGCIRKAGSDSEKLFGAATVVVASVSTTQMQPASGQSTPVDVNNTQLDSQNQDKDKDLQKQLVSQMSLGWLWVFVLALLFLGSSLKALKIRRQKKNQREEAIQKNPRHPVYQASPVANLVPAIVHAVPALQGWGIRQAASYGISDYNEAANTATGTPHVQKRPRQVFSGRLFSTLGSEVLTRYGDGLDRFAQPSGEEVYVAIADIDPKPEDVTEVQDLVVFIAGFAWCFNRKPLEKMTVEQVGRFLISARWEGMREVQRGQAQQYFSWDEAVAVWHRKMGVPTPAEIVTQREEQERQREVEQKRIQAEEATKVQAVEAPENTEPVQEIATVKTEVLPPLQIMPGSVLKPEHIEKLEGSILFSNAQEFATFSKIALEAGRKIRMLQNSDGKIIVELEPISTKEPVQISVPATESSSQFDLGFDQLTAVLESGGQLTLNDQQFGNFARESARHGFKFETVESGDASVTLKAVKKQEKVQENMGAKVVGKIEPEPNKQQK